MGYHAVECLIQGRHNVFVGILNNRLNYVALEDVGKQKGHINEEWIKIMKVLAY
jgi:6-phosphofructokinase 1